MTSRVRSLPFPAWPDLRLRPSASRIFSAYAFSSASIGFGLSAVTCAGNDDALQRDFEILLVFWL